MHKSLGWYDIPAQVLDQALVSKTYTKDGDSAQHCFKYRQRNPGVFRSAGSGRNHQVRWLDGLAFSWGNLVISVDHYFGTVGAE